MRDRTRRLCRAVGKTLLILLKHAGSAHAPAIYFCTVPTALLIAPPPGPDTPAPGLTAHERAAFERLRAELERSTR
ncbi:hypothetical protein [Actinokineospora sp. NBRC 105648]|uniref:hypothetical protein n=1 Tax=Actinokineospora sp. NBRC 105648 TaxID=3032206 RepID=UPI0024A3C52A|nr:hypothetical protein [Actinokineospora sp. NBRC 105648]GLZ42047.1 hypothetical protein Acsp05_56710 [Actinokineospora sp. NBRC 105648]